jgi:23S rRNA pseudouridine1911/1915/1917 synthase
VTIESYFPITVTKDLSGERIDAVLAKLIKDYSRSKWATLIEKGWVKVGGQVVKASYKLREGDEIGWGGQRERPSIEAVARGEVKFHGQAPELIFEDEKLLIVNKPEGLTVHAGKGVAAEHTLAAWLIQEKKVSPLIEEWQQEIWDEERPGIVHRLDRGTSGLLVVAKDLQTHQKLSAMFVDRSIHRLYWALAAGDFEKRVNTRSRTLEELLKGGHAALKRSAEGRVSFATHIDRDPKQVLRFRIAGKGKRAVSHMELLHQGEKESLVELKLQTGRTHQIRVHLSALGLPIVGDTLYGGPEADRIFLHAHSLSFLHPWTGEAMRFRAKSRSFESYCKIKRIPLSSKFDGGA